MRPRLVFAMHNLEASEDLAKLREQYSLKFDYLEKQLVEVTESKQELELSLVDANMHRKSIARCTNLLSIFNGKWSFSC